METAPQDDNPEQKQTPDSPENAPHVTKEKKGALERSKEIAKGTAKALGAAALIGAGTYGIFEATKYGYLDAILPSDSRNMTNNDLAASSAETMVYLLTAGSILHRLGVFSKLSKKETSEPEPSDAPEISHEITNTDSHEY